MKKLYILVLSVFYTVIFLQSQSFSLNITDGYGSGEYQMGDTVHIWAKPVFDLNVFTKWSGDVINYLEFDDEWHTRLLIPEGTDINNVNLTANFDAIPTSSILGQDSFYLWGESPLNTFSRVHKKVFYGMPPNPKAMVFLMHGSQGQAASFFSKYERIQIVKDLMYAGFAVFSFDSNETTMGDINEDGYIRWVNYANGVVDTTNNLDIKNIALSRDSILDKFNFPMDMPTYTLGMSNGAIFSDLCATVLGYRASAHVTARGRHSIYTRDDIVPVIWVMSENDHQENANNEGAYSNFSIMNEIQTAEFHLFRRSPAYPERFTRSLEPISINESQIMFNALQSQNHLDEQGFLAELELILPNSFFNQLGFNAAQRSAIKDQLRAINADHILHADYNKNIIRFFNQFLEPTRIESPVSNPVSINVYPNPTSASLFIESKVEQIKSIDTYNTLGVLLCHQAALDQKIQLNLSRFPAGVYILNIETSNGMVVKKIIKN